MNTIIYVSRGRDDASYTIEKLDEPDYCLIRLGLPAPLWKNLKQWDKEMQDKQERETAEEYKDNPKEPDVTVTVTEKKVGKRSRPKKRKNRILQRKESSIWKRRRGAGECATRDGSEDAGINFMDAGCHNVQESLAVNEGEEQEAARQDILKQEALQQEALRKEVLWQQITALQGELESLQTALCLLGGNTYWTYTVYEERLRTQIDTPAWWNVWKIPEFENYSQPLWAEKILPHGDCPNLLILGQSDCIPGLLVTNARRMRSVKWYLLQKEYTEETEAFIDIFYEEYGLAIEVHLLEEKKNWRRVCFCCPEPVKVLDFSGEAKVSAYGVAKESVWLDMNAMDEKAMRMEVRNQGISYFSLKKLWRGLQKPVNTLTPM